MNIATVPADRVAGSLDDLREASLDTMTTDQVMDVVRRIVDNEQLVPALDVAM
jgi:hypothetical protein